MRLIQFGLGDDARGRLNLSPLDLLARTHDNLEDVT